MKRFATLLLLLAPLFVLMACGGGTTNSQSNNQAGSVFVVGEDAPVSSVVGFNVTIDKITLNNSSTSVQALSTPTAVDFGRLMGLRSLLAFNTIAPGTYNSVTFVFENSNPAPVIDYVDLSANPISVQPLTGSCEIRFGVPACCNPARPSMFTKLVLSPVSTVKGPPAA